MQTARPNYEYRVSTSFRVGIISTPFGISCTICDVDVWVGKCVCNRVAYISTTLCSVYKVVQNQVSALEFSKIHNSFEKKNIYIYIYSIFVITVFFGTYKSCFEWVSYYVFLSLDERSKVATAHDFIPYLYINTTQYTHLFYLNI